MRNNAKEVAAYRFRTSPFNARISLRTSSSSGDRLDAIPVGVYRKLVGAAYVSDAMYPVKSVNVCNVF